MEFDLDPERFRAALAPRSRAFQAAPIDDAVRHASPASSMVEQGRAVAVCYSRCGRSRRRASRAASRRYPASAVAVGRDAAWPPGRSPLRADRSHPPLQHALGRQRRLSRSRENSSWNSTAKTSSSSEAIHSAARRIGPARLIEIVLFIFSDFEPHRAHQLDGVALGDDARLQLVVEAHLAVFDVVLEVDVVDAGRELVGDLRQGEVVGGDDAEAPRSIRPRTTASAPMRRSWELVPCNTSSSRKSTGSDALREVDHHAQAGDLGEEVGSAGLQ